MFFVLFKDTLAFQLLLDNTRKLADFTEKTILHKVCLPLLSTYTKSMKYSLYIYLCFLFSASLASAQQSGKKAMPEDSLSKMLLLDLQLQAEIADAVDYMYDFNFQEAEKSFRWLKYRYPEHPLPYFVLGLSQWWRIMPNVENESYDKTFLAYMDSSLTKAYQLYRQNPENIEASFFLAGAYGFKGRLYAERHNWGKATFAGNNALKYLRRGKGVNELSPEFLFGDGLYNYYSVWIPQNYPALKPVMAFFKKGDKDLGLRQLDEVSRLAFYTRIEAMYFLMRIYTNEENKPQMAMQVAEVLAKKYPNNPYFHRYHAMVNFSQGRLSKAEQISREILERVEKEQIGYEAVSGRYASYYIGYALYYRNKKDEAKIYLDKAVAYAEATKSYDSGYFRNALNLLAGIAKERKNDREAKMYYEKIAKYGAKKKDRKDARKQVKQYKKKKLDED